MAESAARGAHLMTVPTSSPPNAFIAMHAHVMRVYPWKNAPPRNCPASAGAAAMLAARTSVAPSGESSSLSMPTTTE